MSEVPKRLTPRKDTLRELFLLSGNLCAFRDCDTLMMNPDGVFVGQVCHIEAAECGGPRFNPEMTNEERRAADNLMLLCYPHHKETDDERTYPTSRLHEIKREHEHRFAAPDAAILDKLKDWTATTEPKTAANLRRLNEVLGWEQSDDELSYSAAELKDYIEVLRKLPIDVRRFIGAVAKRTHLMRDSPAVHHNTILLASDFQQAHRLSDDQMRERLEQMSAYEVVDLEEIHTDFGVNWGISIGPLPSGWPIWPDLLQFCETTQIPLERFIEDLDFSALDSP